MRHCSPVFPVHHEQLCLSGLVLVAVLHLSACLLLYFHFSANFSATSVPIIMTWLVLEVLMVVLKRGVGVEERREVG